MTDKETIEVYNSRAKSYADLVSRPAPDSDLQAFLDAVIPGGRVLDLGCGPGNSAAMMRDAGFVTDAFDASPEMIRIAQTTYGLEQARIATFDDLTGTDLYDGIWANFSLLHAPKKDMPRHLTAIRDALKPGGIFHIGLKTGAHAKRDSIGRMYSYYSVPELSGLLTEAGFTPRTQREGSETGLDGSIAPFVIMLCDG